VVPERPGYRSSASHAIVVVEIPSFLEELGRIFGFTKIARFLFKTLRNIFGVKITSLLKAAVVGIEDYIVPISAYRSETQPPQKNTIFFQSRLG
jgi:hypothetical protein